MLRSRSAAPECTSRNGEQTGVALRSAYGAAFVTTPGGDAEFARVLVGDTLPHRRHRRRLRHELAAHPADERGDEQPPLRHVLFLARRVLVEIGVHARASASAKCEPDGVDVVGEHDIPLGALEAPEPRTRSPDCPSRPSRIGASRRRHGRTARSRVHRALERVRPPPRGRDRSRRCAVRIRRPGAAPASAPARPTRWSRTR